MNILVLGVGNILLTDEGVGIRAVEELKRRYWFPESVEVLDGGTAGIELLSYLRNKDYLIIIDNMKSGHSPGTIVKIVDEEVPATLQTRISPHQIGLSDLLVAAMLTDELPESIVLFGVEPKSIETGIGLSEEVMGSLDHLLDEVVNELRKSGCIVKSTGNAIPATAGFWANA